MNDTVTELMNIIDAEIEVMQDLAGYEVANYLMESHGASEEDAIEAVELKLGGTGIPPSC